MIMLNPHQGGGHPATTQYARDADITQDGRDIPTTQCGGSLVATKGGGDPATNQGNHATTHGGGEGMGKIQLSQLNIKRSWREDGPGKREQIGVVSNFDFNN